MKLPRTFQCPKCHVVMRFSAWVYAHWNILITRKCIKCGRVLTLREGKVVEP